MDHGRRTYVASPLKLELRNHYLFSTKVTPQNFCLLRGQGHNGNVHVYAVHILWTLISTRFPLPTYISTTGLDLLYTIILCFAAAYTGV